MSNVGLRYHFISDAVCLWQIKLIEGTWSKVPCLIGFEQCFSDYRLQPLLAGEINLVVVIGIFLKRGKEK